MTRFSCPSCGKSLNVSKDSAGAQIKCPGCGEQVTPTATPSRVEAGREAPPGLIAGMSPGARLAALLLIVAGLLGLALASWRPSLPGGWGTFPAGLGLLLGLCSFALCCAIVHGQATRCPACRKWWSKARVTSEFVDRELYEGQDGQHARSVYRTTYVCEACHYRWSVLDAEDYRAPERPHTQRSTR